MNRPAHKPRATPLRVGRRRRAPGAEGRKQRGKVVLALAAVFAIVFVTAVAFVVYKFVNRVEPNPDFAAGEAGPSTVVQVQPGETATDISAAMFDQGVVASPAAFYEAAVADARMNQLQPGYYEVSTHVPAEEAVSGLVDPSSRVGALTLSEGRQLHDTRDVNTGATKEGIYTKIAAASCLGAGAEQRCISYDDLNAAGANTDLAALCVPAWAADGVRAVPDRDRQLEGLIAAGSLDFDPTKSPTEILCQLVSDSAAKYEATGLLSAGGTLSPYQMLIAASLVERESLPQDFDKVARVILNRLAVGQPLQFDSTVNYALDETEVATTDADRATPTPWNTYAMAGLPATPIASPSIAALEAVENPADGPWLYFVTVDQQGTTLFTDDYDEHLRNIEQAMQSGILDSGR